MSELMNLLREIRDELRGIRLAEERQAANQAGELFPPPPKAKSEEDSLWLRQQEIMRRHGGHPNRLSRAASDNLIRSRQVTPGLKKSKKLYYEPDVLEKWNEIHKGMPQYQKPAGSNGSTT